ncbi:head-tail connector protein [Spartinivicinus poritis]|uniref:Head-tail connector protein n=1 Tax=Spartinivicinus poritis TaxID=2994640 RepID=A0ABT5UI93_9GAMM|nr:head-tail connector protein [Spartinivicinus sp. A2-2]MDE1466086.1 head-tail connector protein [Spartinivicinus sp. A2-2]
MIELTLVKKHLNIEDDITEDDAYVQVLTEAAIAHFESTTQRQLVKENPTDTAVVITREIEIGLLMLIGHWYNNRESVVIGGVVSELPLSTQTIWNKYRFKSL